MRKLRKVTIDELASTKFSKLLNESIDQIELQLDHGIHFGVTRKSAYIKIVGSIPTVKLLRNASIFLGGIVFTIKILEWVMPIILANSLP